MRSSKAVAKQAKAMHTQAEEMASINRRLVAIMEALGVQDPDEVPAEGEAPPDVEIEPEPDAEAKTPARRGRPKKAEQAEPEG